jgi:hypothetical protein
VAAPKQDSAKPEEYGSSPYSRRIQLHLEKAVVLGLCPDAQVNMDHLTVNAGQYHLMSPASGHKDQLGGPGSPDPHCPILSSYDLGLGNESPVIKGLHLQDRFFVYLVHLAL